MLVFTSNFKIKMLKVHRFFEVFRRIILQKRDAYI